MLTTSAWSVSPLLEAVKLFGLMVYLGFALVSAAMVV